ncbi:hypothetical protein DRO97_09440, partial [Archaeoglobales archaeon]
NPEKFLRNVSITVHVLMAFIALITFQLPLTFEAYRLLASLLMYASAPLIVKPVALSILSAKISSRREKIESNLHNALVAMLGFAKAGLTTSEIVREVATMDLGELSKEFRRVYYATIYAGMSLKAALLSVADATPSKELGELLRGLVGVSEAGGDVARYTEDRLSALEVSRKVWFAGYIGRIRPISEAYLIVTLVIPIMVIVIESSKMLMGKGSVVALKGIIYVIIPLTSFALAVILNASSPEKDVERRGMNLLLLIPAASAAGLTAGIVLKDAEFWGVALAVASSALAAILLERFIAEESKISSSLPHFFNRTIALVEGGKDIPTAFRIAAANESEPLGKYVKIVGVMLGSIPRHKAFAWLSNAPSHELKMISKVLARTAYVSGRLSDVMLAILGELNRIFAFRKERQSIARGLEGVMLVAFMLYLGICALIATYFFAQFSKFTLHPVAGFSINLAVLPTVKELMRHAGYITAVATSVGIAAVKGDMRFTARYLAILLSAALIVNTVFLS